MHRLTTLEQCCCTRCRMVRRNCGVCVQNLDRGREEVFSDRKGRPSLRFRNEKKTFVFVWSSLQASDRSQASEDLFNEGKAVPPQASSMIQRWALKQSSYDYTIACRKTKQHANTDAMSRLPVSYTLTKTPAPTELVLMVERLQDASITATQIATWTKRDPLLARVVRCIMEGWLGSRDDTIQPFWT